MVTVTAPWTPTDPLGEALHLLRMQGVFYSRTDASEPWALEMPAIVDSLSFHVITAGSCWLEAPDGGTIELRTGDVALVPHGRGHVLASEPGLRPAGRVDLLPQHYLSDHYSVLTYGGGGRSSRLLCGIVAFREPAARALVAALPTAIRVDGTGPSATAVHDTVRLMAGELGDLRPGGEAVTTRLADILVVQAIRSWLEHDPAARTGWLGALHDERIGRALAAIHRDPGADWSLDRLATEATMSRSSFAARFTELVGEPAMTYVTRWRMSVAHAQLQEGATVGAVASSLGYRSEAAFSRAFSRITGTTPGRVRRTPAA
ncbi:AraC family transcriptional regulator [Nitriliruptor alkaliphilus]|uniref:AraC family transcriptional regulator n=1 Tax=Nitriliruptor alkaliphilus TaxID=427918 RepID=UPI000697DC0B|nr:AraC family transcriptional regulator [Nitriliruptor alkaliphilus]